MVLAERAFTDTTEGRSVDQAQPGYEEADLHGRRRLRRRRPWTDSDARATTRIRVRGLRPRTFTAMSGVP